MDYIHLSLNPRETCILSVVLCERTSPHLLAFCQLLSLAVTSSVLIFYLKHGFSSCTRYPQASAKSLLVFLSYWSCWHRPSQWGSLYIKMGWTLCCTLITPCWQQVPECAILDIISEVSAPLAIEPERRGKSCVGPVGLWGPDILISDS